MRTKGLEKLFLAVMLIAAAVLGTNYYESYRFNSSDIPQRYKARIAAKEQEILHKMQAHYGFAVRFPMVVTDRFKGRFYGVTSYDDGQITIYLNKKVMRESIDYMIESVIAHEYAHALLFYEGESGGGDGHSSLWQETCVNLGGKNCQRYVDAQDVVMRKLPF